VGEKDRAVWTLAEALLREIDKLDPNPDAKSWDEMDEFDRKFYYHCVMAILRRRDLVLIALS